jgi:hypothetical protein
MAGKNELIWKTRPLLLKVVGSDSESRRWFGVFETYGAE